MKLINLMVAGGWLVLATAPALAAPAGWNLVWNDEFNSFQSSKWSKGYPWGKTHNHNAYMADGQVAVSNGKLVLTAKSGRPTGAPTSVVSGGVTYPITFTSGAVHTAGKFNVTDGFVEARMKLSGVRGTWPAFWMLSQNGGWPPEIDIMENPVNNSIDGSRKWYYNLHYGPDWTKHQSFGGSLAHSSTLASGFHTYGMAWSSNYIEWYFDGKRVARYDRPEPNTADNMYIIFNLAVGGWGGVPASPFPTTKVEVDWVRVYKWGG